jgi:hypothetical protein
MSLAVRASGLGAWDDELMRPFLLQYKGPLHSQQAKKTDLKKERHDMRRIFHGQLLERWKRTDVLRHRLRQYKHLLMWPTRAKEIPVADGFIRLDHDWAVVPRGPLYFVPLVIRAMQMSLVCELDIRMFWREKESAGVLELATDGGIDLDNRVKGVLDALSIPQDNQLPDDVANDPAPFFCLLENDNLVTRLQIQANQLPLPPAPNESDAYVEVNIDVAVLGGDFGDPLP